MSPWLLYLVGLCGSIHTCIVVLEGILALAIIFTIFIEDRLPKITNDEYFKRYSELVNEEDCNLKYIMTVDCKPIKINRYRNLERAYMLYAKH